MNNSRKLLALTLAAALCAATAQAAEVGTFYGGARGGVSLVEISDDRIAESINRNGHNVSVAADNHAHSGMVYGGYFFTPMFAVEAGYFYLGDFDTEVQGSSSSSAELPSDIAANLPKIGGHGLVLALRQQLPLVADISLVPRLGVVWRKLERDIGSASDDDTGLMPLVSLGLESKLVGAWSTGMGVDLLLPPNETSQLQVYAALEYGFK